MSLERGSLLAVHGTRAALRKGLTRATGIIGNTARPNKMLQLTRPSVGAAWRRRVWRRTVALQSVRGSAGPRS
ncbi:MAG TPA: hypothetical protein VHJ58_03430 [Vicinamibacterales bacterium]|nr:hypothetical protein [Vicinamibacterales bacterium]